MVTLAEIEEFAQRIAREYKPERIILFGSYAYGTPNEHSDVDLLVGVQSPRGLY
jgi:predicted nucleotidyltransferase